MRRAAAAVAIIGAVCTLILAWSFEMSSSDALRLGLTAAGAALAAGVGGGVILWALRRTSLGAQVVVVAATSVASVGAGAVVTSNAMFFSKHDLQTLLVVLVASVAVGAAVALVLGARLADATHSLGDAAGRIGRGEGAGPLDAPEAGELAELARRLEDMARQLDDARARERTLDASRRELIAWVSHDLRTPLAGIRAMAEALEDEVVNDDETVARYYRTMRAETERLAGLVDDLFELSRINAGALRLQIERASLGDLVSDALSAAAVAADARGVRLEGRLTTDPPEVDLSAPEMARVLRNLLENAIRHTPSDGTVTVEAGSDGGHAFVSIADSCGGIPDDDINRVFDVAFRGSAARTPDDGGAGLGLAIARGIVTAHKGDIDVRNDGEGCRFTVRIPLESS